MFQFSSLYSLRLTVTQLLSALSPVALAIEPVEIQDVQTRHAKQARTLNHMLKLNHVNYSILSSQCQSHNQITHILGSAYIFGAEERHLHKIYDEMSTDLEKWIDSPGEICQDGWRDFLGDPRYQRAFVDFFEDEIVLNGYDWKRVLDRYMFRGKNPLINCVISHLGQPLVHLGYAYELSSPELATEALGLAATCYSFLHKYLDHAAYTQPSRNGTPSLLQLLQAVAVDKRLDGLFVHCSPENIDTLFSQKEDVVLEHWNTWNVSNPKKQLEDSQYAAVALFAASQTSENNHYNFLFVQLLSTSHAVRILLPLIPAKFHIPLIRQWWLLALAIYISQNRPPVNPQLILGYNPAGKEWNWVHEQAIDGKWASDVHYVKGLRALEEAAQTWNDPGQFYLKAAVKFGCEFDGWLDIEATRNDMSSVRKS